MPFVRCKFYTESGEPIRGGCHRKGAGCAFIHPGDPDWINAPPASFRARDKGGDSGSFKSWGTKRSTAAPSTRDTGGNARTSTADTGPSWGAVDGWGSGSGWGDGNGWDPSGSTSTPNQVPEPAQPNMSTTKSKDTSTPANKGNQVDANSTASGITESNDQGWGSGWGGAGNGGWGTSGWGDSKDADKNAGSTWRSSGWAAGWGDNKDMTNSWAAPDPMVVDTPAEETVRNKGKGKAVPAPPRIRIPDEIKKTKATGTNNEPLGHDKCGESRSSNFATIPTPVTASTPVVAITPTDLSRVSAKRKRDAAFDDKLGVVKEYVRTWERAVRARFLLAEAEAKRDRWFRTQKSTCYARIGEAGRKRLDGQRTECDEEVNLQRERLSSAITSLVDSHDTLSSNFDLGQRYNISEEAKSFISESKAFVDEVRALLVAHVLKDKNDARSDDTHKHPSGTDATLVDSLRCQVRDLEERFDQAQTELTLRHQSDIRSEVDELLSAKIAALRMARQCEIDRVTSQSRAEIVIPPGALEKIEGMAKRVRELDEKVPRTVEDIRVLLLRVDATTKRVGELEEELSMNKATYSKVQEMAAEKEETERRIEERLEKIRKQFEQLVALQPPGPATQTTLSPIVHSSRDKLMESLRPEFEAVLDKFYEREVRPTIESLQRVVIQASDRHQEEAIKVLWGRIQPAMNMVAGVSRWLDSQELGLTAPVETDRSAS